MYLFKMSSILSPKKGVGGVGNKHIVVGERKLWDIIYK